MLEEKGRVLRLSREGVWVETVRQSSCVSCSARKGCGQRLLAELGQGQRFEVLAENPRNLNLSAGDGVVLGLAENSLLAASAMVYLVPILAMVLCSVLASQAGLAEPAVIGLGVLGLALGFGGARVYGKRKATGCQLHPEILRIDL
ncbi:SoxR reducing system RseC family protein [Motiliproteus sp. SC1-56]|uniref:SoxR reducing system RseC family protein n=1 Tax=Motiliproteus sp. SC1-56 TaxID=2799565 RepID=UPI001A908BE9|nr:SoxR reducing system RseC family protein [Motiliproteus sp. SC1-56]